MASAPPSLTALARALPRAADVAFEARRHAARCDAELQRAAAGLLFLRGLVSERAAPADMDGKRLLDVDAHLLVIERKSQLYGAICATTESIHDALRLARAALERLGASSTSLMRTLRTRLPGNSEETCRHVVNDLVTQYTAYTDRYSDIEAALFEALPGDLPRVSGGRHA